MALTGALNRAGHRLVDLLTPNPNSGAERRLAQPLPAIDYTPVNSPGSKQPLVQNAWYRLINTANREVGYMFSCKCGASNPYLYGRYDLRRELEQDRPCCARCVSFVEKSRDENGHPVFERTRNRETDKGGNVLPVGSYHNLLDILPDRGKHMDEKERNLVYATLPTWLLVNEKPQAPFAQIGDWGGPVTNKADEFWDGKPPLGSDGSWI